MDIVTLIIGVLGASGFWGFLYTIYDKKNSSKALMIGLAHDRIVFLGRKYIERGWITVDEYENLHDYLWRPYSNAGGNGTAQKIMFEVDKLKMLNVPPPKENINRCMDCTNFHRKEQ